LMRHGIMLEKGAGKPRGYKKGNRKVPFHTVQANRNRYRRQKPNPWFSSVVNNDSVGQLADSLAAIEADNAITQTGI